MTVVTFGSRLAGFALAGWRAPPFWLRFLHFVPIAVFAAIIAPALAPNGAEAARPSAWAARLVACGLTALIAWRGRMVPLALLAGLAAFLALRAL